MSRWPMTLIVVSTILNLSITSSAQIKKQPVLQIKEINEGIRALRDYQEKSRKSLKIIRRQTEDEIRQLAWNRARLRKEQSKREGDFVRIGVFKYPLKTEELRFNRTRDVIQRVVPGVDEDPVYLEMLARQAASIEMVLRREHAASPNPKMTGLLDRVLLGTIPDPDWRVDSSREDDYSLVMLSDGFISFMYQAGKSVVLSWRPMEAGPRSTYSLSTKAEDIEDVLNKNPYAQELLYKTLYSWLFTGRPRAFGYHPPPAPYIPALEVLINHSERFVIAHEYGHALGLDKLVINNALPLDHASWNKEFAADTAAFAFDLISAQELDKLPPNVALQGGLFALSARDVVRQALDIVRYGKVRKDKGCGSYPPLQNRIEYLKDLYRQQVGNDVKYKVPVDSTSGQSKTIDLGIEGALAPSNTLTLLWKRIQPRFLEARRKGVKLDHIWDAYSCY